MPGMQASAAHRPATMNSAFHCPKNCAPMSAPSDASSDSDATRVTTRPAATAMHSEGICETSPSPMEMSA